MTYRGFEITAEPGMCCPSVVIRSGTKRLHTFPHNEPHASGLREAERWIDAHYPTGSRDWMEAQYPNDYTLDCLLEDYE